MTTVHVESFRRKLSGRKTWSTAPTYSLIDRKINQHTWVAINKCSIYFGFGAASLTFVAPNTKWSEESPKFILSLENKKVARDMEKLPSCPGVGNTFDRFFVCGRHSEWNVYSSAFNTSEYVMMGEIASELQGRKKMWRKRKSIECGYVSAPHNFLVEVSTIR